MGRVILDTDIVSFLFRNDKRKELYRPHLDGQTLIVSFMTAAELYRWGLVHNWGHQKKDRLERELNEKYFVYTYASQDLCRMWARIKAERRAKGRSIKTADAWIAAIALCHALPLVSHNRRDFDDIEGLNLIFEA
jgi:tRNA(fMet)-specific endonuclease VapC